MVFGVVSMRFGVIFGRFGVFHGPSRFQIKYNNEIL